MDALTAKLGKLSKPQIILTAAGAGIAMAIAYRLADRTLDSVLPKKKVEEEEVLDEPKAHPAPPAEGAKVLSGCYDVKIGDRVVADVAELQGPLADWLPSGSCLGGMRDRSIGGRGVVEVNVHVDLVDLWPIDVLE